MKHGKKQVARRIVLEALSYLQNQIISGSLSLGEGFESRSSGGGSMSARQALLLAVERVEPLLRLKGTKRGAKTLQMPRPLTERQRSEFYHH